MQLIKGISPSLTIGGRVFTDLKNLIQLYAFVSGAGNGNCTFRRSDTTSGYTPSGSKTFRVLALRMEVYTTFAGAGSLLYSDNDVGIAAATAFTNAKSPLSGGQFPLVVQTTSNANIFDKPINFVVPNGKYLGCTNNASAGVGSIVAWGYEE